MSDHIFSYASYTSHLYKCVDSTRDLVEVTRRGESSLHYNSPSCPAPGVSLRTKCAWSSVCSRWGGIPKLLSLSPGSQMCWPGHLQGPGIAWLRCTLKVTFHPLPYMSSIFSIILLFLLVTNKMDVKRVLVEHFTKIFLFNLLILVFFRQVWFKCFISKKKEKYKYRIPPDSNIPKKSIITLIKIRSILEKLKDLTHFR